LDFRGEIFSPARRKTVNMFDLALFELFLLTSPFSTTGNYGAKRSFAFAQSSNHRECIFHFWNARNAWPHVSRGAAFCSAVRRSAQP